MQSLNIAVIRGDGIGPEFVDAALQVLESAGSADGLTFDLTEVRAGAAADRETGLVTAVVAYVARAVFDRRYAPAREQRPPSDRFTREPAPAREPAAVQR